MNSDATLIKLNMISFQIIKYSGVHLFALPLLNDSYSYYYYYLLFCLYDFFPLFSTLVNFIFKYLSYKIQYTIVSCSFLIISLLFSVFFPFLKRSPWLHYSKVLFVIVFVLFSDISFRHGLKVLPSQKGSLFGINYATGFISYCFFCLLDYEFFLRLNVNSYVLFLAIYGIELIFGIGSIILIWIKKEEPEEEKPQRQFKQKDYLSIIKNCVIFFICVIITLKNTNLFIQVQQFLRFRSRDYHYEIYNDLLMLLTILFQGIILLSIRNKINYKNFQIILFSIGIIVEAYDWYTGILREAFGIAFVIEMSFATCGSIIAFEGLTNQLGINNYFYVQWTLLLIPVVVLLISRYSFNFIKLICNILNGSEIITILIYCAMIGLAFVLSQEETEETNQQNLEDNIQSISLVIKDEN